MTKTPTTADLRRETRDWLKRGAIPAEAARARRQMAETVPALADWHEAFAAEWDRIAAKFPEKVRAAYLQVRDYHLGCIASVERIGHLNDKSAEKEAHRAYHQGLADAAQAKADAI